MKTTNCCYCGKEITVDVDYDTTYSAIPCEECHEKEKEWAKQFPPSEFFYFEDEPEEPEKANVQNREDGIKAYYEEPEDTTRYVKDKCCICGREIWVHEFGADNDYIVCDYCRKVNTGWMEKVPDNRKRLYFDRYGEMIWG